MVFVGLKINSVKAKLIKINTNNATQIRTNGVNNITEAEVEVIEDINRFFYIDFIASTERDLYEYVDYQIIKVRQVCLTNFGRPTT